MSITLQDHIFPVALFRYVLNVHHAQCRQFYILVSILSPICQAACFLKYTQSPTWKAGLSLVIVF